MQIIATIARVALFVAFAVLAGCASFIEGKSGTSSSGGGGGGFSGGSGSSSSSCTDECNTYTCAGPQVIGCQQGTDGCFKKLAPTSCADGKVCKYGIGCAKCSAQSDCTGATDICSPTASCTYYGGQTYKVTIKSVKFDSYTPSGDTWDVGSDPPDPQVCVYAGTAKAGCTSAKSNVYSAYFGETIYVKLSSLDSLVVRAWDSDALSDDEADNASWSGWIKLVKAGSYSGDLGWGAVNVSFDIVPAGY